jgi:DNA polymerase
MLIGASPTKSDWESGVVLKEDSAAGSVIDSFLKSAGIEWDECWRTTACKCHSPSGTPITYPQLVACSNYLKNEIRLIQPKLILAFGTEAMASVTPYTSKIFEHVGEVLNNTSGLVGQVSSTVVICVNPVSALRSERCASDLEYSSSVVRKLLEEVGYE